MSEQVIDQWPLEGERADLWREWLNERPDLIKEMAASHPPSRCYRSTKNEGHYRIEAYSEDGTMSVVHGSGSFLPGMGVFGVDPLTLIPCGCGVWKDATQGEAEATTAMIKTVKAAEGR